MLHVPVGANSFGLTLPSWGTTRPAAANGTSVTPGTGAYGTYAQVGSDLVDDAYGLLININSNSASAASRNTVVKIGIDPAGGTTYTDRITGLLAGGASTYAVTGGGVWYYFPLFVPAGAAIAAAAFGTVTTALRVGIIALQRPANPALVRCASYAETLGITGTAGTSVTPGTTSEGAWTSIGTTARRLWWWQASLQVPSGDTAWNAATMHLDLGVGDGTAGGTSVIIQDLPIVFSTAEVLANPPLTAGVEWAVPAGSSLYVRAQSSGTLDTYTAAVYGAGG